MSKPKEISPAEYAIVRPILVAETKATMANIKLNLMPREEDYFTCPLCLKPIQVRDGPTHYCMDCYVPKTLFGNCIKCGKPLHIDNDTDKCLNRFKCK